MKTLKQNISLYPLSKAFGIQKTRKVWRSETDESILLLANPVYRKDGCIVIPTTSMDCYTSVLFSSTLAKRNSRIILQATDKVSFSLFLLTDHCSKWLSNHFKDYSCHAKLCHKELSQDFVLPGHENIT